MAKVHASPPCSHTNIPEQRPPQRPAPRRGWQPPSRMALSPSAPRLHFVSPHLRSGCLSAPTQPAATQFHPFPPQPTDTADICLLAMGLGLRHQKPRLRPLARPTTCTAVLGELGPVASRNGGQEMTTLSDALEKPHKHKPCRERMLHVWEPAVGKIGWEEIRCLHVAQCAGG